MSIESLLGPMVICTTDGDMKMLHPGLPLSWGVMVLAMLFLSVIWAVFSPSSTVASRGEISSGHKMTTLPRLGAYAQQYFANPWVLLLLKLMTVAFFVMVIIAGLYGTPIAERNMATVLTWNLWWSGLVFSIFLFGSAWCAICPWDAIAQWLVRRRLWKRAEPTNSLNLRLPRFLKNVWPALILFIVLTWLELGLGITMNPYATAVVALFMVVAATIFLALFQRKAFCRNVCPVGRTIGFYSQLAPVELRPINNDICSQCETLECYHGNQDTEPCPTWQVMGSLKQNSYCLSCGNCGQSCPDNNIAWRLRAPSIEAIKGARPRWDEAWFMLGLLALTGFHGITMMPFWESWMTSLARMINDSGQLLISFTIGLSLSLFLVVALYSLLIMLTRYTSATEMNFKQSFSIMAFACLPMAFAYHMAHNLNHLIREGAGFSAILMNPLGQGSLPLTEAEKHQRHLDMWLSQDLLNSLQAGLMVFGFVIAVQTIRHRGLALISKINGRSWARQLSPMLLFALLMTLFHLWMLSQPMLMRM